MIPYYTRFFFLSLLMLLGQLLIFDHINLFGYSNPAIYVGMLLFYRLDYDQFGFILIAFFYGLAMDLLSQTAGAHTLSCLTLAFVRPYLVRFSFGTTIDNPAAIFSNTLLNNRLLFLFLMLLIHQLIYVSMAYFSWAYIFKILLYGITNTLFSFLILSSSIYLFSPKK